MSKLPDEVCFKWNILDVLDQNRRLTNDQAREVLQLLVKQHDANTGVNWDVIDCTIEEYLNAS